MSGQVPFPYTSGKISVIKTTCTCLKSGAFLPFLKSYKWRFFLGSKSEILLKKPKLLKIFCTRTPYDRREQISC